MRDNKLTDEQIVEEIRGIMNKYTVLKAACHDAGRGIIRNNPGVSAKRRRGCYV